ncbi:uncharacterized protein TNCV_44761 [Trichonephila clavipes]|nr:uncharacterized protein TNCV_44761 [Trichonephila clavipes]
MNLSPTPKWFYDSMHTLNNATMKLTKVSMALAAAEAILFNNGYPNVPVTINGTWLKRSHTFLNGVVTAVSLDTGKVVDAKILSQKCSCNFKSFVHSNEYSGNYIVNNRGMEVEEHSHTSAFGAAIADLGGPEEGSPFLPESLQLRVRFKQDFIVEKKIHMVNQVNKEDVP